MKITISTMSECGGKQVNQDDLLVYTLNKPLARKETWKKTLDVDNEIIFAGVADGVSSTKKATLAAETALDTVLTMKNLNDLSKYIITANRNVASFNQFDTSTAACTLSCVSISKEQLNFANVGDSPIYRLRDNKLEQLALLHTLATLKRNMKIDSISTSDEHTLINYIGNSQIDENSIAHYFQSDIKKNDIFLLCTDGITDVLSDEKLIYFLKKGNLNKLMDEVAKKASDNITAILIQINEI